MYGLPDRDARRCPTDGAPCDLFQPDESRPCRLLLVCPDCGRWIILKGFHQADADAPTWRELGYPFGPVPAAAAG
jgi:hypothetical protein